MSTILYKARSNFEFFYSVLQRMACLAVLIYLAFYYHENPTVITAIGLVCFLLFIFIGNDEITVYEDKITQGNTSIISLFSRFREKTYDLAEIRSASVPIEAKSTVSEIGVALFLAIIFKGRRRRNTDYTLFLDFKSGERITITTSLEQWKVDKIVETVNSILAR